MARGQARFSGTQVRMMWGEVQKYAEENDISVGSVVVSINLHSGRIVLTDYEWDDREMRGEHTEDTPQPKNVGAASIRF